MNTKTDKTTHLLNKNSFRKIVFIILITTTIIVNMDYIQLRDSSKADLPIAINLFFSDITPWSPDAGRYSMNSDNTMNFDIK